MTATARLKQLLFIAAALALVGLGLVAAVSTASPARATDTQPCVPKDAYTETIEHPAETHTVHHDAVTHTVHHDAVPGPWWNWSPDDNKGPFEGPPAFPSDARGTWQGPHTEGGPSQDLTGTFQQGAGNAPWFHREAGQAAYDETVVDQAAYDETVVDQAAYDETVVDKEAWTETINHPAVTCDTPPVEKKIVVCKYVGTPPGTLDHIVIVSENTLNNLVDENGNPFAGQFPFSWTDAQGQTTNGSIAIRFATDGEQAKDVALTECPGSTPPAEICPEGTDHAGEPFPVAGDEASCNDEEEVCPEGTDHAGEPFPVAGDETSCDEEPNPGPDTCPEGTDKAGEAIPADKTAEEFCDDDDEVCPPGTDHAGEEVKHGDDPGKVCNDKDDNPHNPGEPNGPSNHPNPGPTVKGAQASAPSGSASSPTIAAAVAPAAAGVPNAIDAGLAPSQRDLTEHGGPLGLLGVAGALLGAGLVGASLRPRRRRSLTV